MQLQVQLKRTSEKFWDTVPLSAGKIVMQIVIPLHKMLGFLFLSLFCTTGSSAIFVLFKQSLICRIFLIYGGKITLRGILDCPGKPKVFLKLFKLHILYMTMIAPSQRQVIPDSTESILSVVSAAQSEIKIANYFPQIFFQNKNYHTKLKLDFQKFGFDKKKNRGFSRLETGFQGGGG